MSKASLRRDMQGRLDAAHAITQPIPICRQGGDTQPIPAYVEPKPVRIMADPPELPKTPDPKPKRGKPSALPVQVIIWAICILITLILYQLPVFKG